MQSSRAEQLVEAVNQALDPVALLNMIGFLPEKKVLSGTTLRAACPVHRDAEFLTLFINTRKRTCRCSVNTCAASESGSLVHLYALCAEVSDAAAARELVGRLALPVDLSPFEKLASDCFAQAEEHFVRCELRLAEEMAQKALDIDPAYIPACTLLSRLHATSGDLEQATLYLVRGARALNGAGKPDEALKLLERGLAENRIQPEAAHETMALIHLETGDTHAALRTMQARLDGLAPEAVSEALLLLEQMVEIDPKNRSRRETLAKTRLKSGDTEGATNIYMDLAQLAETENDRMATLRYLDSALDLNSQFLRALQWKARLLTDANDRPAAAAQWRRLARLAEDRRALDEARECFIRARQLEPKRIEHLLELARVDRLRGQPKAAALNLLEAATLAQEQNDKPSATVHAMAARELAGDDAALQRKVGDLLLDVGDVEASVAVMVGLAEQMVVRRERDGALEILKRLLIRYERDGVLRLRVVEAMEAMGFARPALQERAALAKLLFIQGEDERVLQVVGEGLHRIGDADPAPFYQYRIEALRRLERPAERDVAVLEYAQHLLLRQRGNAGERLMTEMLATDGSPRIFQALMEYYLERDNTAEARSLLDTRRAWVEQINPALALNLVSKLANKLREDLSLQEFLGDLLLQNDNAPAAYQVWSKLLQQHRDARDLDGRDRCLQRMKLVEPDDPELMADSVLLILERGQRDIARRQALELLETWKDQAPTPRALAMVDEVLRQTAQDDPEALKAALASMSALVIGEGEAITRRLALRLAELQVAAQPMVALETLRSALRRLPGDIPLTLKLCTLARRSGGEAGSKEALEHLREAVSRSSSLSARERRDLAKVAVDLFPNEQGFLELAMDALNADQDGTEMLAGVHRRMATQAALRNDSAAERASLEEMVKLREGGLRDLDRLAELRLEAGDRRGHIEAMLMWAAVAEEEGLLDEAVEKLSKLRDQNPQEIDVRQALVGLHRRRRDPQTLASELLGVGDMAMSRREYSRAELHFREARTLKPGDPEILERLAQMAEERGLLEAAASEYRKLADLHEEQGRREEALVISERVNALVPGDEAALEQLARLQVALGRRREAASTCLKLARQAASGADKKLLVAQAKQALALSDTTVEELREIAHLCERMEANTEAGRVYLAAAIKAQKLGKVDDALGFARRALKGTPDSVEAQRLLVDLRRESGQDTDAAESLRHLAGTYAARAEWDNAIAALRELLELAPDDHEAWQELAECLTLAGRPEESLDVQEQLCLRLDPDADASMVEGVGRRLLSQGRTDPRIREAMARAYGVLGKKMPEVDQRARLANAFLEMGDLDAAVAQSTRLNNIAPAAFETLITACYIGDREGPVAAATAWGKLTESLLAQPDAARIVEVCRLLKERPAPELRKRMHFAAQAMRITGADDAEQLWRVAVAEARAEGRLAEALAVLDEVLAGATGSLPLVHQRAQLLGELGRREEAARAEQQWAAARLSDAPSEALAALERAAEWTPTDAGLRLELAELALKLGDPGRAKDQLRAGMAAASTPGNASPEVRVRLLERLLAVDPEDSMNAGELVRTYEATGQSKRASTFLLEQADRAEKAGKPADAEQLLRNALRLDDTGVRARRSLAELLGRLGRESEAYEEYLRLADQFEHADNHVLALQTLNRAREFASSRPEAYLRLGSIYLRQNSRTVAAENYERGLTIMLEAGSVDGVIEILEEISDTLGEGFGLLTNLFNTLVALNRVTDASRQGIRLARLSLRRGEERAAKLIVERLLMLPKRSVTMHEMVAELFREFESYDEALGYYREGAKLALDQKRHAEALRLCEGGLTLRRQAETLLPLSIQAREALGPEQAAQLREDRRRLAGELLKRGAPDDRREAVALLEAALESAPGDPALAGELTRAYASFPEKRAASERLASLANRLGKEHPETAIALLNQALESGPPQPALAQSLLDLHLSRGEDEHARQAMLRLAEAWGGAGDFGRQESTLLKLIELDPDSIEALRRLMDIARRGRDAQRLWHYGFKLGVVYEGMGQPDEARRIYEEAVMMDGGNLEAWLHLAELSDRMGDRQNTARICKNLARAYENRGQRDQAIDTYQRILALTPGDLDVALEAAELSAQAGEMGPAAKMLEDALTHCDPTTEPSDLLEEVCRRLLSVAPESIPPRQRMAVLLEARGAVTEAAEEWGSVAALHRVRGDLDQAAAALRHQAMLVPTSAIVRQLATLLRETGKEEEAQELWRQIIDRAELAGAIDQACALAVEAAAELGDVGAHARAAALCARVGDVSGQAHHTLAMAEGLMNGGDYAQADLLIEEAAALQAADTWRLPLLRVRLMRLQGRQAEAQALAQKMAARAIREEDWARSVEVLGELRELRPEDPEIRVGLIKLHGAMGQAASANASRRDLFDLLLRQGQAGRAVEVIRPVARRADLQPEAIREMAAKLSARGSQGEAADLTALAISTLIEAGRHDAARELSQLLRAQSPNHPQLSALEAALAPPAAAVVAPPAPVPPLAPNVNEETAQREAERLETLERASETKATPALAHPGESQSTGTASAPDPATTSVGRRPDDDRIRALVDAGKFEEAREAALQLSAAEPWRATPLVLLARAEEALGNRRAAAECLRRAADIHAEADRVEAAHAALERLLSIVPDDLPARQRKLELAVTFLPAEGLAQEFEGLGLLLTTRGDGRAAQRLLSLAAEILPDEPVTARLRMEIGLMEGEPEDVVEGARADATRLCANGRTADAANLLAEAARHAPRDAALHEHLAELYASLGQRDMAFQEWDAALALLEAPEDAPRRLGIMRKSAALEPESPARQDHLMEALFAAGQLHEGVNLGLHLSDLYWKRHMAERAEAVLRRVLTEDPLALMALEKLMALKRQTSTEAEVAEECYQQARHLLEHSGEVSLPGQLRQMARRLLSSALKRVPDSIRYLRAMVDCPHDGDPEQNAHQRLRLAKAYVEAGEMEEALGQLLVAEGVLGPEHSEVQPVRLLIEQSRQLLPPPGAVGKHASTGGTRTERTEAVENFLRVLRLDPDNLEVNQALAITYREMGNPTGEVVHQREVCRLLEQRGRFEELMALLQDMVARYPQSHDFGEQLRSVRLKVRAMSLLEGDETQTMLDEEEGS